MPKTRPASNDKPGGDATHTNAAAPRDAPNDGVGVWYALSVLWGARRALLVALFSATMIYILGYSPTAAPPKTTPSLALPHRGMKPDRVPPWVACGASAEIDVPLTNYTPFTKEMLTARLEGLFNKTVGLLELVLSDTEEITMLLKASSLPTKGPLVEVLDGFGDAVKKTNYDLAASNARFAVALNKQVALVSNK